MAKRKSTYECVHCVALAVLLLSLSIAGCGGEREAWQGAGEDEGEGDAPAVTGEESPREMSRDRGFQVADTVQGFHGILVMGEEVQVLRLCGSEEETWVRDRTGQLSRAMRELETQPYQAIYVNIRGTIDPPFTSGPAADYRTRFEVSELLEASLDTARCEQEISGAGSSRHRSLASSHLQAARPVQAAFRRPLGSNAA